MRYPTARQAVRILWLRAMGCPIEQIARSVQMTVEDVREYLNTRIDEQLHVEVEDD